MLQNKFLYFFCLNGTSYQVKWPLTGFPYASQFTYHLIGWFIYKLHTRAFDERKKKSRNSWNRSFLFPSFPNIKIHTHVMSEANAKTPLLGSKKPPLSRPKYLRRRSSFEASTYNSAGKSLSYSRSIQDEDTTIPGLNLWKMLTLTICMAGVQFTCKHITLIYLYTHKQTYPYDWHHDYFIYSRDRWIIASIQTYI